MNEFKDFHPLVSFVYFVSVIAFSMVFMHPVCLAISLLCGFTYYAVLGGRRAVKFTLGSMVSLGLMSVIINPVFNHEGVTILGHFPDGNPITMESAIYGLMSACMIMAVISWFLCMAKVVTSDKVMYLFGKVVPSLSLVFSMVLSFMPRLKREIEMVSQTQKGLELDPKGKGIVKRLKYGVKIMSIVVSWAFEDAAQRADSMRSRGYGLPHRTAFSIYELKKRDFVALLIITFLCSIVFYGGVTGNMAFAYFPAITPIRWDYASCVSFLAYFGLLTMPIIIEGWEALRWKALKSKI